MELVLPQGDGWSGAIVQGVGAGAQPVWAVIVKRAFRRAGTAFMPDGDGEGLILADATETVLADEDDWLVPGEPDNPRNATVHVTREHDLAPFKGATDVAVLGHLGGDPDRDGRVILGGVDWLSRTHAAVAGDDRDADRHLFGFEPRADSPREAQAGAWPDGDPPPALPIAYPAGWNPGFLRFQRRGAGYAGVAIAALPEQAQVDVHRTADASDTAWRVAYDLAPLRARHFTWCGHGPDRIARWCGEQIAPPAPDTLILEPDSDTASIIWRAVWPLSDHPAEFYRRLEVSEDA